MNAARLVLLILATILASVMLGASLYDSVVMAPNLKGAPASLEHARGFMHVTNPGALFRVISPLTQVVLALAFILVWKLDRVARWVLGIALACAVTTDVVTFQFHYPRNHILFAEPLTRPAAEFDRIAEEWAAGNYVRLALEGTAVTCAMIALVRTARRTAAPIVQTP